MRVSLVSVYLPATLDTGPGPYLPLPRSYSMGAVSARFNRRTAGREQGVPGHFMVAAISESLSTSTAIPGYSNSQSCPSYKEHSDDRPRSSRPSSGFKAPTQVQGALAFSSTPWTIGADQTLSTRDFTVLDPVVRYQRLIIICKESTIRGDWMHNFPCIPLRRHSLALRLHHQPFFQSSLPFGSSVGTLGTYLETTNLRDLMDLMMHMRIVPLQVQRSSSPEPPATNRIWSRYHTS